MRHSSPRTVTAATLAAVVLVFLSAATTVSADSLITNGDFTKWTDGVPEGWKVGVGARSGADEPKSEVKPIKGPALMLRGDASTMAWNFVSQEIPANAGGSYSLAFESRAKGVKKEGPQFGNCYVGVMFLDSQGKPVDRRNDDVSADADWTEHRIDFVVPQNAATTEVTIFLSQTGILGVTKVTVEATESASLSANEKVTAEESDSASLLVNGDFRNWSDGLPVGWTVDIGANNGGDAPRSELKQLDDPGLSLSGDASTMAWYSVGQELSVRKGVTYTLEFLARSENVRQQGRQWPNCYVGVLISDANGKRVDMPVEDLSRNSGWRKHRLNFRVPANAAKTELLIFLSKTGTLSVKNLSVKEATPSDPFAALVDSLKSHYSFSALKGIDWDEFSARYCDKAQSAQTVEDFAGVIREMLSELEDLHVWIELPGGSRMSTFASGHRANCNHPAVAQQLNSLERFGRLGFVGRTEQGFGVVVIAGLPSEYEDLYERLFEATTRMFEAPGFIVDLRSNGGGAEGRAKQIAGLFADKRYLYARSKVRSGPNVSDLSEASRRYIEPAVAEPFTRPVVCLVGPGCVSSGEEFALMMKAIDHVTLVGQPTRGASGNPAPVTLSNGVRVWFSRWVSMEPDGIPFEGRGIRPDIQVEHSGSGDPTFDRAVEILSGKTGIARDGRE